MELTEAYRECERITWSQARNFAYGIRLLPPAKRRGLAAIYAFARRIDDIGDGTLPAEQKIAALEDSRRAVLDLAHQDPQDPVLLALADVERTFGVPIAAFGELIDGCVADVRGTTYTTWEDLHHYCRCVAGSVGRLSLGIFGVPDSRHDRAHAAELADSLGVALQLTNILRDIREDYANGRVYLPAEDLAKFDCDSAVLGGTIPPRPPRSWGTVRPPYPPDPLGQFTRLSSSRSSAPATGTPPGCACSRCSTAAAPRAPARWRASTDGCSSASPPSPPPCSAAACRCRGARRPPWPSRPWPGG